MVIRRSPSSIIAYCGTVTLVAGAAAGIAAQCETNIDKCTILLSRNTPAGTLGFLFSPAADRGASATTFSAASSSNLDTSTVNWVAIPKRLGLGSSATFTNSASLRRSPSGLYVRRGEATLVAGTATVTGIAFPPGSLVFVTAQNGAGTMGKLSVPTATVNAATGQFVINSDSNTDTSRVGWVLVHTGLRFSPSGTVFSQARGAVTGNTVSGFSNMNPSEDPNMVVLASVIDPATPGNLSAPFGPPGRPGNGTVSLLSSNASDASTVELAGF